MTGGKFVPPHHTNVCNIPQVWGATVYISLSFQQNNFKLGNFTNLKVLFLAELTEFP